MARKGPWTRPANRAEGAVWDLLRGEGFQVLRKGWPDFLAVRNGTVRLVEVKRMPGTPLRRYQQIVFDALQALGVTVEVLCPPGATRKEPRERARRGRTQAIPYPAAVS